MLENNGPSIDLVDLIFIGDGYSQDELSEFASDVEMHINFLFSIEPFQSYRSAFNIYRIDSTIDLGAERPDPNASWLLIVNEEIVFGILDNLGLMHREPWENIPPYYPFQHRAVIALVNETEYGGSGGDVAVSISSDVRIMVHEFGHSFGDLWDEYVYSDAEDLPYDPAIPLGPNVDWDGSKWAGVPGTGAYLGATHPNLYRPTYNGSLMRDIMVSKFGPVSKIWLENLLKPRVTDSDGDGFTDFTEKNIYGTDSLSADTDNDGLLDNQEIIGWRYVWGEPWYIWGNPFKPENYTNPLNPDTDDDDLKDGLEVNTYGTNPLLADTDNDSLTDGLEINGWSIVVDNLSLNVTSDPLSSDSDGDNLNDWDEYHAYHTNPRSTDTDGDLINDYEETQLYLTNPLTTDTDEDGLTDFDEVKTYLTNPNKGDTDEDGLSDIDEITVYLTNPLAMDSDGDGLADGREITLGLNPLATDTDGDLWNDSIDPMPTNAFIPNAFIAGIVLIAGLAIYYRHRSRRKRRRRRRKKRC